MISHNFLDSDRVRGGSLELRGSFGKSTVGRSEDGKTVSAEYRVSIPEGVEYGWECSEVPRSESGGNGPGHVQHGVDGVDQQLRAERGQLECGGEVESTYVLILEGFDNSDHGVLVKDLVNAVVVREGQHLCFIAFQRWVREVSSGDCVIGR